MINKIIDYCASHRFLVFLFIVVAVLIGGYSMRNTKLDAIPDLSDTQVIIYSRWDRSPDIMEDQVTYPIVTALLGAPKVKVIRGFSAFGYSYVYVVFKDGTDISWARRRLLEFAGKEFMVRGRGYVRSKEDLEKVVLKTDERGTPVLLRDVGDVSLGPELRRGVSDLDGMGDTVCGIVVMRHGENARAVIERVRDRLKEVEPSLPKGVRIVTTYDRSELIERSIENLKHE